MNIFEKKYIIFLLLTLIVCISLSFITLNLRKIKYVQKNQSEVADSSFYVKDLENELAGRNYRKGGKVYQPIVKNDTLNFYIYLSESIKGRLAIEYRKKNYKCSHKESIIWLKKVLPEIQKKYCLDSLKSIYLGRLVSHGDLAIQVSKQYREKVSKLDKIGSYKNVFYFFMQSQIKIDFNDVLKPYNLELKKISAEKIFFASKNECESYSLILTEKSKIPAKILDGIVYLYIGKLEK